MLNVDHEALSEVVKMLKSFEGRLKSLLGRAVKTINNRNR